MTIELYVTNTETIHPRRDNDVEELSVRLYGRTRDDEAKKITVEGFSPYFYVPADETDVVAPVEHDKLERYEETDIVPLEDRFDENPRKLAKVVTTDPYVRELRQRWDRTWSADVEFTSLFRIEKDIKTGVRVPSTRCHHSEVEAVDIEDVEPRVLYFDIETDDRATGFPDPGEARILSIAAYNSGTGKYATFIDGDEKPIGEFYGWPDADTGLIECKLGEPTSLKYYRSERRMLMKFAQAIEMSDPDIITGWNSGDDSNDGFDLPHLIERMKNLGISVGRLSREGYVDNEDIGDGEWRTSIKGRSTYDLMDGWANTKFTKPDSKRLNDVAATALDDFKLEHPDMGYFEMYESDPVLFTDYNTKDTRLAVEINHAENVFGFYKRLKDMIGVDWEETRQNNDFVEMSVRRKCREHGVVMVTAWDNEHVRAAAERDDNEVNFEGAYVFDAFSGLKRNVVGKDLASLYPMTQYMLNASPDTKVDRLWAVKNNVPHVVAENGACFRTDVDSIIKELVDEYDEIKMEFKRRRNEATYGTEEWDALAVAYGTTKTIYNSYYGYTGWDKSPLYDPDIAAAVTLTGQVVIKETARYINEETEAEVVYGDTDSNYAEYPDDWEQERILEYAQGVCDTLNEEVYPELCDQFNIDRSQNEWFIELEMLADRFFQSGSKKFYAYRSMWSEGMPFDEKVKDGEGSISIAGYACVKSNFSALTKDTQRAILHTILEDGTKQDVADIMFEAASSIDPANPDWDRIGMPQGLGKKLSKEKSGGDDFYDWSPNGDHPQSAHPRGAWFANHLLDVKLGKGSQPKRCYVKPTLSVGDDMVDVIAYEDHYDLEPIEDELKIDAAAMQEKLLVNPMDDILDAFGLEMDAALQGKAQTQTSIAGFN
ncbi:DNA polymerase domain-containing protein [Halomonas sp.]|uniref:DNA polymerase domain-containing protein n=1 Tax=Halomonas sp. TaxID=1486246 RepID=UPI00356A45BC